MCRWGPCTAREAATPACPLRSTWCREVWAAAWAALGIRQRGNNPTADGSASSSASSSSTLSGQLSTVCTCLGSSGRRMSHSSTAMPTSTTPKQCPAWCPTWMRERSWLTCRTSLGLRSCSSLFLRCSLLWSWYPWSYSSEWGSSAGTMSHGIQRGRRNCRPGIKVSPTLLVPSTLLEPFSQLSLEAALKPWPAPGTTSLTSKKKTTCSESSTRSTPVSSYTLWWSSKLCIWPAVASAASVSAAVLHPTRVWSRCRATTSTRTWRRIRWTSTWATRSRWPIWATRALPRWNKGSSDRVNCSQIHTI